jgi:hypothetical protein
MRFADVEPGKAYVTGRGLRARVRVLEVGPGRQLSVAVEAGSVWNGDEWVDQGATAVLGPRDLESTWSEYAAAQQDGLAPEPMTRSLREEAEDAARREALLNPARSLPLRYQSSPEVWGEAVAREEALSSAEAWAVWKAALSDRRGPQQSDADAARLLMGVPAPVARDLLAALIELQPQRRPNSASPASLPPLEESDRWNGLDSGTSAPGAPQVAAVFRRAASLLLAAIDDAGRGLNGRSYPGIEVFTRADADFANACVHGGAIATAITDAATLPAHLADRLDPSVACWLTWVPVAIGRTSGRRLHQPGCHILRDHAPSLRGAKITPLWYLALHLPEDTCGVCGGPMLAEPHLAPHFLAASDAWNANGRREIEPWQRASFARYLGASVAVEIESDAGVALTRRLLDQFGRTDHGRDGWQLYEALTRWTRNHEVTDEQHNANQQRAKQILADALELADLEDHGMAVQKLATLEQHGVPHPARILFSLPDASRL